MSADDDGPGRREVARRVFAAEYDDADYSYSESDEERAPNYVVVPTGARVNRLFAVGVLTETEAVNEDVLRARVVDPTGAFVVYAGQYQPDAVAALERTAPPAFVAVTGKARTFQPDDADRVYTSVRPESINEVDADTRDRWTVRTAEHTLARVAAFADALDRPERGDDLREALEAEGVAPALAAGIPRAIDHYGTTPAYLAAVRDLALDAARVVSGEREEVAPLELAPDEGGDADVSLAVPDTGGAVLAGADAASAGSGGASAAGTAATGTATDTGTEAAEGAAEPSDSADSAETDAAASEAAPAAGNDSTGETADATEGTSDAAEPEPPSAGEEETGALPEEDATDEMYELDEEEREEIESEYGTEFASGDDIPDAGEADIETPDADELEAGEAAEDTPPTPSDSGGPGAEEASGEPPAGAPESEPEAAPADAGTEGSDGDATPEPGAEGDEEPERAPGEAEQEPAEGESEPPSGDELTDAVVEEMRALGDGGAVGRQELVEAIVGEYGVDEAAVEDAIQDALMSGRCYESGDDELTPI